MCISLLCYTQKLHNVEIALKSFSNYLHIPAGTTTQSIVEGHREKTLTLLWAIIFHFKVHLTFSYTSLSLFLTGEA